MLAAAGQRADGTVAALLGCQPNRGPSAGGSRLHLASASRPETQLLIGYCARKRPGEAWAAAKHDGASQSAGSSACRGWQTRQAGAAAPCLPPSDVTQVHFALHGLAHCYTAVARRRSVVHHSMHLRHVERRARISGQSLHWHSDMSTAYRSLELALCGIPAAPPTPRTSRWAAARPSAAAHWPG